MPATPGLLTSTVNLGVFALVCTVAWHLHGLRHAQKALTSPQRRRSPLTGAHKTKVIVISGCDRGFGRLLAEALSKYNTVLVVALTLTEQAAQELSALPRCVSFRCNVTSDQDISAMKKQVETLLQNNKVILHAIVNNAGIADPGDFAFFRDIKIFDKVMNVNFMGQVRLTQALLPFMLRTSAVYGGRIVNLSSVCGTVASAGNGAYNASKFAVEGWSDSIRLELAPLGIAVVKVRPGQFSTQIQSDWVNNFLVNYQQAPMFIRELYGEDAYAEYVVKTFAKMSETNPATDPSLVVDALEDMLTMDQGNLKPHYWLGNDAHTIWRAWQNLPTQVADGMKAMLGLKQMPPSRPPPNVVSHLTITVRKLDASVSFYCAFGMESFGEAKHGQQFLRFTGSKNSNAGFWPTLVLLREDASMPPRGECSEAGMTRLCLITTTSMSKEVKRLENDHGIKPMGPTCYDGAGLMAEYLTAYKDPDGFVVYIIEFQRLVGWFIRVSLWWYKNKAPCPFHWTVNVTDAKKAMKIFQDLGFVTASDQSRNQIMEGLLPAFNIDPKSCVIEHVRLCKLPKDVFHATIMEWAEPRSAIQAHSSTNALTIAVDDVGEAMEVAKAAGMVMGKTEYRQLPVFGSVLVGTAFVEANSCPIEFCCFTYKQVDA